MVSELGVSKFADLWVDEAYRLPLEDLPYWTVQEWCEFKIADVVDDFKAVMYASQIPRRLGGNVTAPELGRDKRQCRKLMHSLRRTAERWGSLCPAVELYLEGGIPPRLKKAGAQMQMERWLTDQIDKATLHRAMFATRALQVGSRSAANKGARFYTQEIDDYRRILALPLAGS